MIDDFLVLVSLLLLSGLFSGAEIAFFSLSQAQIDALVAQKRRGAKMVALVKSKPERLLSAILIGNNIVNISASAFATLIAIELLGDAGAGIAVGVMTLLILIFGEITPKALAAAKNEEVALSIAYPLHLLMKILTPILWALEKITHSVLKVSNAQQQRIVSEEEIKAMITQGAQARTLDKTEHELLENVFEFDDITAEDAMTVYKDIFSVDGNKELSEVLKILVKSPFSRIPVYEGEKNNITGILRMKEVLQFIAESHKDGRIDLHTKIKDLAAKPFFIPQGKPVDELLREFKKRHKHIAIVVNEYGDTVGLITMEDILEQLVGQIADESDVNDFIIKRIDKNSILVDGDEELVEINDFFNVDIPGPKNNSISWLILEELGRIPEQGEVFDLECGLMVTIKAATDRTIQKVILTKKTEDTV